ncbi:MAG: polyphosphate kinase 2 family protein [Planctomycetes bacterium]|nr:polyphosphate kinase 2 family protein [Planctomycetota bacterium]
MLNVNKIIDMFRVTPGKRFKLAEFDTGWDGDDSMSEEERKKKAGEFLTKNVEELAAAQELLYAADTWSVLCIFQAIDAAGKDGTIKHVMSGVNPQGVQVVSFKRPSAEELDHDFLWRCSKALPERGRIGIFNRSYYEEVLTVKVHPEFVAGQRIPKAKPDRKKFWKSRYDSINEFERHLSRNGTRVIKFFLNVSKEEQKKRLLARINDPKKNWKFEPADLAERARWDDYMSAFETMLRETSTKYAPWYVLPADKKWVCRPLVATILAHEIEKLNLKFPTLTEQQKESLLECKKQLESE